MDFLYVLIDVTHSINKLTS
ncbi:MAG TPA: CRISPR-associated DxTHG motif protein [Cycloclasticus sp.]|nr:CRISPR-associated DxTHG motif protein [Cycloclasticus sp.]HIL91735.1 CRISPR-associated DxTHG motif protein [Cycloclasticus sp.]